MLCIDMLPYPLYLLVSLANQRERGGEEGGREGGRIQCIYMCVCVCVCVSVGLIVNDGCMRAV